MKLVKVLFIIFSFLFVVCISTYLQNYKLIPEIDYEVKLVDLMNLLATICIGLAIPFYVSKLLEDKRAHKIMLIDECKTMLSEVEGVKNLIISLPNGGRVSLNQKNEIMFKLEISEKQLDNLILYLSSAKLPSKIFNEITFKQNFLDYWDVVTGGNLMARTFTMSNTFKSATVLSFLDLEKEIKLFISKLQVH